MWDIRFKVRLKSGCQIEHSLFVGWSLGFIASRKGPPASICNRGDFYSGPPPNAIAACGNFIYDGRHSSNQFEIRFVGHKIQSITAIEFAKEKSKRDNVNVHRAAANIIVSQSRAARGSVCNVLLSRVFEIRHLA